MWQLIYAVTAAVECGQAGLATRHTLGATGWMGRGTRHTQGATEGVETEKYYIRKEEYSPDVATLCVRFRVP